MTSMTSMTSGFNPCFNGFMDKDTMPLTLANSRLTGFNPCFNGFMDKDRSPQRKSEVLTMVSTLVLMDSWIKTTVQIKDGDIHLSFNPCFNGFMDKDFFNVSAMFYH